MARIAIAYSSGAGHTRILADCIAEAAGEAGCAVHLADVERMEARDWDTLANADAIVFGSPTFMGSVSAPFKAFMDTSSDFWTDQLWRDKLAAGFTVGSSPSGDKSLTLTTLVTFAAQHAMIWVGQAEIGPPSMPERLGINEDGHNLGLAATSSRDKSVMINPGDRETAAMFGRRIAWAAQRWAR